MTEEALSGQNDLTRLSQLTGVTFREDEHLLAISHIHGAIFWKSVALILVSLAIALLLPGAINLAVFLGLVGFIMFALAALTRHYLMVAVTNYRIVIRSGLIYADVIELHYNQLETVEVGVTLIGQFFGYANLVITGAGQRRVIVPFIANAVQFRQVINEQLIDRDQ